MNMNLKYIILLLLILITVLLILILINQNKSVENYYTIPDSDITEEICKDWFIIRDKGPLINPISKYPIEKNKATYKEFNKKCKKFETINKKYKSIDTVPEYLKVLYTLLFEGYVKVITEEPTEKYDRKKLFGDSWKKANHSECDTRSIVLYNENKGNIVFSPSRCNLTNNCEINDLKCTIYSGEWEPTTGSYFTTNSSNNSSNNSSSSNNINPTYTFAKLLDVDHTVPLKHAYYAGASKWDTWLREKYANDLTPGHLLTMVYYLNTEKGEKDPSDWLPPNGELKYVSNWLAVKYRYGLIIQPVEFNAIQDILDKYQGFTPDQPVELDLDIGYETISRFNTLMEPIYIKDRETVITDFNKAAFKGKNNIKRVCNNPKLKQKLTDKHMNIFKQTLLKGKNHAYFGLLRPEYVNLIQKPEDICNYNF
jgi:hypothetical protein